MLVHINTQLKGIACFVSRLWLTGYLLMQIRSFSFRFSVNFFSFVSVTAGLLALLLILLEWTRPGLPSPLRPICDLRVLNHFIKEARDAEVAMVREKRMRALRSDRRPKLSSVITVVLESTTLNIWCTIRSKYPQTLTPLLSCFLRSHVEKDVACQNLSLFPKPELNLMSGRRKM